MTTTATKPEKQSASAPDSPLLIESLHLQNFLSFGPDAPEIELGLLNILIGANGSGKSNLIEAIVFLRACPVSAQARDDNSPSGIIRRGGGADEWIWKGQPAQPAELAFTICNRNDRPVIHHLFEFVSEQQRFRLKDEFILSGETELLDVFYHYKHGTPEIRAAGETLTPLNPRQINANESILAQRDDPERYPELSYLSEQYNQIAIYREWTFGRSTLFRQPQRADMRIGRLEEDFSNLGLILNRLYGIPKVKRELIAHLKDIYAEVDDIHISIVAGTVQIFLTEGDYQLPATRLSDGTLRYLCLLAILCDPAPPPLICLEEPELGLHPDLIPKVADLLKEASTRTQLIVTTHSDILVDAMTSTPEVVIVCEKHNGQTEMKRLSKDDLGVWLEKYRLGELWTRGEIGGTRW